MSAVDIIERGGDLLVSSETIAEGSGVEHRAVLQLIATNATDFEDFGDLAFEMRDRPGVPGPALRVALLNEQQATLLMTFQRNTPQVREFKKALVRAFFDMARMLASNAPALPQSYSDALRELASTVDERDALQAKVEAEAPKVLFANSVAASQDSVGVAQLATILRQSGMPIGEIRLFELLRDEGYLCKSRGADWNRPTQRSMDMGLFEVVERTIQSATNGPRISVTPKVTGRGQQYFVERYADRFKPKVVEVAS